MYSQLGAWFKLCSKTPWPLELARAIDDEMIIRSESGHHYDAVRQLHVDAFPTSAEADLVDRLRADGDAIISLVAFEHDRPIGHVMLSKMDAPFMALGLAPIAVAKAWRRRGVAARLIEAGIRQAKADGWDAIFVLGEPSYYRRFGFSAREAARFDSLYAGPGFMSMALGERDLTAFSGRIDYAPAFKSLG